MNKESLTALGGVLCAFACVLFARVAVGSFLDKEHLDALLFIAGAGVFGAGACGFWAYWLITRRR